MRDKHDPVSEAWEDADLWMRNWHTAHPDEEREDLDIYMSTDYDPQSPYWPLRDVHGTLIDFHIPQEPQPYEHVKMQQPLRVRWRACR